MASYVDLFKTAWRLLAARPWVVLVLLVLSVGQQALAPQEPGALAWWLLAPGLILGIYLDGVLLKLVLAQREPALASPLTPLPLGTYFRLVRAWIFTGLVLGGCLLLVAIPVVVSGFVFAGPRDLIETPRQLALSWWPALLPVLYVGLRLHFTELAIVAGAREVTPAFARSGRPVHRHAGVMALLALLWGLALGATSWLAPEASTVAGAAVQGLDFLRKGLTLAVCAVLFEAEPLEDAAAGGSDPLWKLLPVLVAVSALAVAPARILGQGYEHGTVIRDRVTLVKIAGPFKGPEGLAFDAGGKLLVADGFADAIFEVDPKGRVAALPATPAMEHPLALACDDAGTLYVGTRWNKLYRRSPAGKVEPLVSEAGPMSAPGLLWQAGQLYVLEPRANRIRRLDPAGRLVLVAGGPFNLFDGDGERAYFARPSGLAPAGTGDLVVADAGNHRLRLVTPAGKVTTWTGGGRGHVDGPLALARFEQPAALARDLAGNLFVVEPEAGRLRRISPAGQVTTLLDRHPGLAGVAARAAGTVYVADRGESCLQRIDWQPNQP